MSLARGQRRSYRLTGGPEANEWPAQACHLGSLKTLGNLVYRPKKYIIRFGKPVPLHSCLSARVAKSTSLQSGSAGESPLVDGHSFNQTEVGMVDLISGHVEGLSDVGNGGGPTASFGATVSYQISTFRKFQTTRRRSPAQADLGRPT